MTKPIKSAEWIEVPKEIASCPWCGTQVAVHGTCWEYVCSSLWQLTEFDVECDSEECEGNPAYEDLLSFDSAVLTWVNANYRFVDVGEEPS